MKTYLFAWNPLKWAWENLEENVDELKSTGEFSQMWSCKSHRKVEVGDRAFLIKLGKNILNKGIIGSGYIASEPFLSEHWSGSGELTQRVIIDFEHIAERSESPIIPISILKAKFENYNWSVIASGVEIPNQIAKEIEKIWFISNRKNYSENTSQKGREGNPYELKITKYERNPYARETCLNFYGFACSVCAMDFQTKYGEIGKDFIHVHHLKQISEIKAEYEVDPIQDLRPVCPNCHSMIHRRKTPFTIEEIKSRYNQ